MAARRTRADGSGHYSETEATDMLRHAVRAASASGDADAVATAAEYAVPGDIDDDGIRFIECGSDDGVTNRGVCRGIQRTDESEHTNLTDIGDTNLQRTVAAWHDPLFIRRVT